MTDRFDPATLDDGGLGSRSVKVLCDGQHQSGAFIASPNFASYRYAWLRDGAFCARALDVVGEHARAGQFHRWVERTVLRHGDRAESVIEALTGGRVPDAEEMLPTRYDLEGRLERPGEVEDEPWPNFQLDGYGTWLHELETHHRRTGNESFDTSAVDLIARYLAAGWQTKCYDCWEEFGDGHHASTLAAIAAGLSSAARLLGNRSFEQESERVRTFLLTEFVRNGYLRKGRTDDRVDASLLWTTLPFGVLDVDHPTMGATAVAVRSQLQSAFGGIYRYRGDTYFGGGEWVLLTCWLAWYDARTGNRNGYEQARRWVIASVDAAGDLPEQTTTHAQEPTMVDPWVRRWGPVATPLLWSHAMYLIASEAAASWN